MVNPCGCTVYSFEIAICVLNYEISVDCRFNISVMFTHSIEFVVSGAYLEPIIAMDHTSTKSFTYSTAYRPVSLNLEYVPLDRINLFLFLFQRKEALPPLNRISWINVTR